MSVILAFATPKFGIIASDGRFCSSDNHAIIDEHFNKTVQFNSNIICGFAGSSRPCVQMIVELQNHPNIETMPLESMLEIMSQRLPVIAGNKLSNFLLIGKDINGLINLCGIGTHTKYLPIREVPDNSSHKYMSIAPPGIDVDSVFIHTLLEFQPDIQKGIDMTILRVSQLSETVNDIRFQREIFL